VDRVLGAQRVEVRMRVVTDVRRQKIVVDHDVYTS
jgi:hypothetical protein